MKPFHLFGLVLLVLVASNVFAGLDPNATGANSQTYLQNYQHMVNGSTLAGFNTTIVMYNGTKYFFTGPEYDSSTTQKEANLVETYIGTTANFTLYEIRTDLFSEQGIALAMSNQTIAFDRWVNTVLEMDGCGYGILPCWVKIRDGITFYTNSSANDTAIDGTLRIVQALYIASQNTAFSTAKQAEYLSLANQLIADSYAYETISITSTNTDYGAINRVAMGGADCASFGLSCSVDMWSGYMADIALTYEMAYNLTGNATYDAFARNVTAATLQLSLQNDTDGDGFGVMPFNFNYDISSGTLRHTDGGGVNSYHYNPANPQWDDSDAPRHYMVGQLLNFVNQTGRLSGVYTNLSTYIDNWIGSGTMTSTTSCLQYYYNGTCATTIQGGYYQNGFGGLLYLAKDTDALSAKVNETLTHYGWAGNTFDSTSGGTALTYRGVRTTKLLGYSIGLSTFSSESIDNSSLNITDFNIYSADQSTNVTGGSAVWYADIRTYGDLLQTNSSGIYLTNINYTKSDSSLCTASSIIMTNGIYNTSQFESNFSSEVTCNTIPAKNLNAACMSINETLENFAALTPVLGIILISVVLLSSVGAIYYVYQGGSMPSVNTDQLKVYGIGGVIILGLSGITIAIVLTIVQGIC